MEAIFGHLDADKSGSVTCEELAVGLRALPHFKTLSDEDVRLLVDLIDFDKSGEISLQVRRVV